MYYLIKPENVNYYFVLDADNLIGMTDMYDVIDYSPLYDELVSIAEMLNSAITDVLAGE